VSATLPSHLGSRVLERRDVNILKDPIVVDRGAQDPTEELARGPSGKRGGDGEAEEQGDDAVHGDPGGVVPAGPGVVVVCANLEEDLFNLVAHNYYERVDWRNHSVEDDLVLRQRGLNRVTDTCIPEQEAIRKIETHVMDKWQEAIESKETWPASHYLMQVIDEVEHQAERTDSWLAAAVDMGIPVFTPGWADSTLGNVFSARMIQGDVNSDSIIASDLSEMGRLADWYRSVEAPAGLLQIGGGIAGDFPICVVPMLRQDIGEDVPLWAWFAQISESRPSYGGYSGAPPNEKVSWEKLDVDSPKFVIESDATIVVPLLLEYVHR